MISKAPKWLKRTSILVVTLAATLLLQLPAHAQTDQGRITGTVRDQNGALVAGASRMGSWYDP
jgi:hypothetical protein